MTSFTMPIFAPFGIAQTSLTLLSLIAKIGFVSGYFERPAHENLRNVWMRKGQMIHPLKFQIVLKNQFYDFSQSVIYAHQ